MKVDIKEKAREVYEVGYCIIESVYSEEECRQMRKVLQGHWHARGSPRMLDFGFSFQLLVKAPGIAPYLDRRIVIDTMAEVFQDNVRFAHGGCRRADENSKEVIHWHDHYRWDEGEIAGRERIKRVLANVYVDGSSAEVGHLIVLPRSFHDPLEPKGEQYEPWPGQMIVEMPPGSVAIFDTLVFHTAVRGTRPGIRHVFGGHYQGWSYDRPHREDNPVNVPEIERFKDEFPGLKSLVEPA